MKDSPTDLIPADFSLYSNRLFFTGNEINFLLKSALLNIAFLPYGYLLDRWRWKVLDGSIKPSQYNSKWWEMRTKYQGVKAPVKRTENDFDPGSKFHVPNNTPYIR